MGDFGGRMKRRRRKKGKHVRGKRSEKRERVKEWHKDLSRACK